MDKSQGVVWWRRHDSTLEVRVEGWGTMPQSLAIRRWVENQPPPAIQTLRVDLAGCSYMDSTFIGTLIYLKRQQAKIQGSFALVHPSPECRQLLAKMGIAKIFCIAEESSASDDGKMDKAPVGDWQVLPIEPASPCSVDFKENVVEAHQRLAEEEGCSEQFKNLAELLQREMAAEKQKTNADAHKVR
jgi:anti-anti-sigma factor